MRHTLTCLVVAAMAGATPNGVVAAGATQWKSLGTDRDGELFYDPASVRRTGARVRLTTRVVATTGPSDPPFSMVAAMEIDCAKPSSATLSIAQYGAGPDPVRTRIIPADRIEHDTIYRDSSFAELYRVACPKGPPLRDAPKGPLIQVVPPAK